MINEISRGLQGVAALRSTSETEDVAPAREVEPEAGAAKRDGGQPAGVDGSQLNTIVKELNDFVQVVQRRLEFSIDQDNGEVIVRVVDAETRDVVREIPAEEVREMRKRLSEVSEKLFQPDGNTAMLFQAKA